MATKQNSLAGTRVTAVPKETPEIGIETTNRFIDELVEQALNSNIDISKLEGFSNVTQTREQLYQLLDTMSQDPILASYLQTISEDAVEPNDSGQIIWAESSDSYCSKYVTYLLDALNVDKNAYGWMHSLTKYGDLYLRLFRKSEYEQDDIFSQEDIKKKERLTEAVNGAADIDDEYGRLTPEDLKQQDKGLKEDVNVVLRDKNDKYVHYVEAMPNPGEMFELTKFGKTMGFVHAPIHIQQHSQDLGIASYMQYRLKRNDVDVYSATDFVHASLTDNSNRVPEEVSLSVLSDTNQTERNYTYKVKRGQSELTSIFKIWRQLSLLENSALLNRVTSSSVTRVVSVEVGDMPKEKVGSTLQSVKNLMEQKTALDVGNAMQEYTNPGPVINNIYSPTRSGVGAMTFTTVGGDFDPKQLTDIAYFQDKMFGALGVPKAFFGITDDGAGFNGGQSLSIISSRYGKSVKRLQNVLIQAVTDLINLFLLDRGLVKYINNFTIKMQPPVTQEELDRRSNKRDRVGVISDIMNQLNDIEDKVIKLKVLKSLLADSIADADVVGLIEEYIEKLELEIKEGEDSEEPSDEEDDQMFSRGPSPAEGSTMTPPEIPDGGEQVVSEPAPESDESPATSDMTDDQGETPTLPTFAELGVDGTINN